MFALIDTSDPTGAGMFSKQGRVAGQKIVKLKQKAKIDIDSSFDYVPPKRKIIKRQPSLTENNSEDQKQQPKQQSRPQTAVPKGKATAKQQEEAKPKDGYKIEDLQSLKIQSDLLKRAGTNKNQPFFLQVSRQQTSHYINNSRPRAPPQGAYNIKYSQTEKRCLLVWNILEANKPKGRRTPSPQKETIQQQMQQSQLSPQQQQQQYQENSRNFFDSLNTTLQVNKSQRDKIKGHVDLSKQLSRERAMSQQTRRSVCDKRFEVLNMTEAWSNIPRKRTISFRKQTARDYNNKMYQRPVTPDAAYSINLDLTRKKDTNAFLDFDKQLPHQFQIGQYNCLNQSDFYDFDKYNKTANSNVFKKLNTHVIDFDRMAERFPVRIISRQSRNISSAGSQRQHIARRQHSLNISNILRERHSQDNIQSQKMITLQANMGDSQLINQ